MILHISAEQLQMLHCAISDQLESMPQEFWQTQQRYARALQLKQRMEAAAQKFNVALEDAYRKTEGL